MIGVFHHRAYFANIARIQSRDLGGHFFYVPPPFLPRAALPGDRYRQAQRQTPKIRFIHVDGNLHLVEVAHQRHNQARLQISANFEVKLVDGAVHRRPYGAQVDVVL